MKLVKGITALLIFCSTTAFAGECVLTIKRTACPGKEAEAFKPYMGKVETKEKKEAATENACGELADAASKIVRKGTLSEKHVMASFDGKDLGKAFSNKADCK